jgi:lipid-A-disaccharide synthase
MIQEIMMAAGEVSGDLHGANLAKALLREKRLRIFGMGGRRMEEAGVELTENTIHLSSVGISEAFRAIPKLYLVLKRLESVIKKRRPRVAVLIDNQGFNLQLAKALKREGIPILYYLPPQIWAFGGWEAKKIAGLITHVLAVFKFEEEAYLRAGAKVSFIGHPFLDIVYPILPREEAYRYFGLHPELEVVGLLPGSRRHEISRHLPILLEGAKEIIKERPNTQFILPLADPIFEGMVLKELKKRKALPLVLAKDCLYDAISLCELVIASSGTVTLEAAILEVPMIVVYKTSLFTWWISRSIVKVPFAGMPNILLNRPVVKELLQGDFSPKRVKEEAIKILSSRDEVFRLKDDLKKVVSSLGSPGAIERAKDIILSYI